MRLLELKQFLVSHKSVSMLQLCQRFNSDAAVMRDMLQHFINKGNISCCKANNACGTQCVKCNPLLTEVYQWVGDRGY